jgi:hypothetical protein
MIAVLLLFRIVMSQPQQACGPGRKMLLFAAIIAKKSWIAGDYKAAYLRLHLKQVGSDDVNVVNDRLRVIYPTERLPVTLRILVSENEEVESAAKNKQQHTPHGFL